MKTLKILERTVSYDVKQMSKGLCDLHTGDMATMLAFGMLDAQLIEAFEAKLTDRIEKEFGLHICATFPDRVLAFIKECIKETEIGVYKYAKMVV